MCRRPFLGGSVELVGPIPQLGDLGQPLAARPLDGLRRIESGSHQRVDHGRCQITGQPAQGGPSIVFGGRRGRQLRLALDVDPHPGELGGEPRVLALLADGQRELVVGHDDERGGLGLGLARLADRH